MKHLHLFLLMSLYGCAADVADHNYQLQNSPPKVTVDNTTTEYLSVPTLSPKVEIIKIDKDLSLRIGSRFEEFFQFDGNKIILIDRRASEINCIDREGRILWTPIPPHPETDRYERIGSVEFDSTRRRLYVEDRYNAKVDIFDLKGNYLSSKYSLETSFLDFTVFGEDNIIFDISEPYLNYPAEDGSYYNLMYVDQGRIQHFFPYEKPASANVIPSGYHNRFNSINGDVQFRTPFDDIIYEIFENYTVNPILSFDFAKDFKFVEFAADQSIKDVHGKLEKLDFPIPYFTLYDDLKKRFFLSYYLNKEILFTCTDKNNQLIPPGHFYQFGEHIVDAPMYYSQGKFYQILFKYEYDYMQKAVREGISLNGIAATLEQLKSDHSDLDDVYIIATEFL